MKLKRHLKITELIQQYEIETQEELADKLKSAGFNVTQATVSRDIKELRLVKVLSENGRYKYAPGYYERGSSDLMKYRNILVQAVSKIDYTGNLIVIKCYTGMAQGAAVAIDSFEKPEIVGSIAGDDTILLVMRQEDAAIAFAGELTRMIKQ